MKERFRDKVVVITGGASGIGLASTQLFLAEGAEVWVADRGGPASEALRKAEPAVHWIKTDVTKGRDLESLFASVRDKRERIDVLFANAGIAGFGALGETTEVMFDALFDTNVKSVFFTVKHALPLLGRGSSVVLNTSFLDEVGVAGASALSASKAAVRSLTRSLARELGANGIRVNAVSPGPIATPLLGKMGLAKAAIDTLAAGILEKVPMGRFGTAEEVARAVLFLASADASFTLGAELAVDGGAGQL